MAKAGICTIACRDLSLTEAIDTAAEVGAEGVEVWGQPPHVSYPPDPDEIAEVVAHAAAKGIEIPVFGSYYRVGREVEYDGVAVTKENQIELTKLFGAPIIRIWAGTKNYEECSEDEIEAVMADVREFGDRAADNGISVVLERHANTILNRWDNVAEVMERIGHDNVALNWQIPCPAGNREYRENSVDDYMTLLPYAGHCHMQNHTHEESDTWRGRTLLDEGIADYSRFDEALRKADYDGWLMLEFAADERGELSKLEAMRHDIGFLKAL